MTATPWMKFYPRDWRGDQALRAVSIAARGLWMECLCIMHEARPYGHLVLNGIPVEVDTLARMTGVSVDEASALLAELRQAGVLSMTGKGVVFSRRMIADHARANKGRNAVEKRWNQTAVNTQENSTPNRSPNSTPITQRAEVKGTSSGSYEPSEVCPKPAKGRISYPSDFEEFWKGYPVDANMAKKEALTAWRRLPLDDRQKAIQSLPGFRAYCAKDPTYRPVHACRYLSQQRFLGHLEIAKKAAARTLVMPGTPQFEAWITYRQSIGERTAFMESEGRAGRGWMAPSEWPPRAETQAA